MSANRQVLAFDFGASSGRAMLGRFDGVRIELEEIHRFPNDPVRIGGTLYWDVLRLFHEIKQGLIKAKAKGPIDSLGIDTWGVDFALLDKQGQLLQNPVHYRDRRTEGVMDQVFKVIPREELYARTGIQFQPFNTIFQLQALQNRQPELVRLADRLLLMPDLFVYFLTGVMQAERTMASTGQLLRSTDNEWDLELLRRLRLPGRLLCRLVDSGTKAGVLSPDICRELHIDPIPVITVAAHDTASAVVAVPAADADFIYLSSGTWSLMGIERKKPIINDPAFRFNFTNEGGFKRSTRVLKNIAGLWLIQESRRQWSRQGEHVTFAEMEQEALASRPFAGLIDPDDPALAAPGDIPERIREICRRTGQVVPGSRGEIVRCIYESLALKYRVVAEQIEKISGCRYPVIHVVGGGAKDELLSRFTANATGIKVIAGPAEGTALGNIAVQLIASGAIASLRDARRNIAASTDLKHYQPEDTELWEAALIRYRQLFPDLV